MALLKFIGGIRLRAALVKCGITLAIALLDLTAGVILTAKKVAIRAWEAHSDSGRTSTMYLQGKYHFELGGTLKIAIPVLIINQT